MKKQTFLFLVMAVLMAIPQQLMAGDVVINETTFPDENFRNWVLAQDYGQDGVLTEEEISMIDTIKVPRKKIYNLTGIERFTALKWLDCDENEIGILDMSKNTALIRLDCWKNALGLLDVSKNTALEVLSCGINHLTSLNVSNNTALKWLWCGFNELTSIDVSKNTALTQLECHGNLLRSLNVSKNTALTSLNFYSNYLTSLDVSKNTALKELSCHGNHLTSLDVSKNTALTDLNCDKNHLISLDASKNTALKWLWCSGNLLTSLDVSNNPELRRIQCSGNLLTSLDVSKNTKLWELECYSNKINETEMGKLVESMNKPGISHGNFVVKNLTGDNEQNIITKPQVAAAQAKGWTVYAMEGYKKIEYEGVTPHEIAPINQGETIDIGNKIDEDTDLDGNVIGGIFYSISNGNGNYNAAEGCIVVTKPTEDSAIDGKDIFGEDFKAGYTGIVFKMAPGEGSIKVEAKTQGNMVLKVKIGNNAPVEMNLEGKLKVSFPYNVSEDTYVYIYGGTNATEAKGMKKIAEADELKIYGIEVVNGTDGIKTITQSSFDNSPIYNLNGQQVNVPGKGIFIKNGKKVMMK